jgi:surface protein
MYMYVYVCIHTCCVRARACVRMCDRARTHPRRHMRARSVGVDRGWLGSQAFAYASAFNADIGAWNTASVTSLGNVCAALSARRRGSASGTRSAGRRCGAGRCSWRQPPMRARAQTCGHAHSRMSTCVGIAARSKDGLHVCMDMYVYIRAASVRARVCVCDWARTHPRRRMRARSVGVDRGWLGSQAFNGASAFNADIGAWNTASVTSLGNVCAALSARRRGSASGTRSAGVRCGAGRCARRRRRCALACVRADVSARACAGVHVRRYSCA